MRSIRLCMAASVVAACAMAMLVTQSAEAQTFKVLHTFDGAEGAYPSAACAERQAV